MSQKKALEILSGQFCEDQAHAILEAIVEVIGKGKPATPPSTPVWLAYAEAYKKRYKHDPVRNAKVNALALQLHKRLGDEAPDVVQFYVFHNNKYYFERGHPLDLAVRDAESLRTQWARGRAITTNDSRQVEKMDHYRSQLQRVDDDDL